MPLESKFHRASGRDRLFVDREDAVAAFTSEWAEVGRGPLIFNPVGVGGVGKSRLLRQLRKIYCEGLRTAVLDLQVPAMRQQEDALAALRIAFGQHGIKFDRFDISYAVLWQRLHPHLQLSHSELPFIAESDLLSGAIEAASGVRVFGTAVALLKLVSKFGGDMKRKRLVHGDQTLQELDDMSNQELVEAVTFLFAEDLRAASSDESYVVFVDAYEALAPGPLRTARSALADAWLRDLVVQLDRGLTVIASREPLAWAQDDSDWEHVIHSIQIDALPMSARLELLASCGIADAQRQDAIARASAGLPFYLNLAIDSWNRSGGVTTPSVVSRDDILRRFLQHVGDAEARALELLAVCRLFDYEIFQVVVRAFGLPHDRLTWESLCAYSFVYPTQNEQYRLHELMRENLQVRLPEAVRAEINTLLHETWRGRAATFGAASEDIASAQALREQVYHGLHAKLITGEQILAMADSAFDLGGRATTAGILGDLQRYLSGHGYAPGDLAEAAVCLEAEMTMRLSAAPQTLQVVTGTSPDVRTVVGARLATAAANAYRTLGDTGRAQNLYRWVWQEHQTQARDAAGIWYADLEMCQGRFPEAVDLASHILQNADPKDLNTLGDVHRLLHLTYRFACDFEASERELALARDNYKRAGSITGLANIATNAAELLAWREPPEAFECGESALRAQEQIGDQAEIGKIYTAMGIAHLSLGKLPQAHAALHSAEAALERARYRSGHARAELIRACVFGRSDELVKAQASARWAVSQLLAADVYPTLIILADQLLHRLGAPNGEVTMAARAARTRLHPLDTLDNLESRIQGLLDGLLGRTK